MLLLFGGLGAAEVWEYLHQQGPVYSDFFGIWSWSRFVAVNGAASLYDPAAMHQFQRGLDPLYTNQFYPFLYPPTYLLFIWPLAHFELGAARWLWSAATLGAFLLALFGLRWRASLALAALVAPATILCLICGQNGLLTAALMLGGLRLAGTRPLLAGLLLGLLSYKPHLALLVPVALVAARLWPTLLAAAATAIAAVTASAVLFGVQAWTGWLIAQRQSWTTIDRFIDSRENLVPTVSAALRQLGCAPGAVTAGQCVATLAAATAIWFAWGRGARPVAIVPVAALLATPYAFIYDLPMLAGAALVWFRAAAASGEPPTPIGTVFLGAALLLPQAMFGLQAASLPIAAPVLALILLWLLLADRDRAASLA